MKVQQITEPEWAEGKDVTLSPDTVNITDLTVEEFETIREAVTMQAKISSSDAFVKVSRLMLALVDAEVIKPE